MELINMPPLPNPNRVQFPNLESKQVWGEKLRKASQVYPQLEYLTVAHGLRDCMIDHYTNHSNLAERTRMYADLGLMLIPMMEEKSGGSGFSHTGGRGNLQFRSVVTKSAELAEEFIYYHDNRDDINIGSMLGFPETSCVFFDKVWKEGYVDPVWQSAENTGSLVMKNRTTIKDKETGEVKHHLIRLREFDDHCLTTPVFRYFNIRLNSHIPRAFDDMESLRIAKQWQQLARDLKIDGIDELVDIMRLPYQWDCLKGIALITTPVFRMEVSSVPCYPRHIIQQEGEFYPKEAPTGIQFPYRFKGGLMI